MVNGIVGTWPKWPSSVVVAVPVCRPARPARAHPSLGGADEGGKTMFADGSASFSDGNAAARAFGRAHRHRPYHSKRTSPFRKGENKSFNACIAYANGKTQKMVLA